VSTTFMVMKSPTGSIRARYFEWELVVCWWELSISGQSIPKGRRESPSLSSVNPVIVELFSYHQRIFSTRTIRSRKRPILILEDDRERYRILGLDTILFPPYASGV